MLTVRDVLKTKGVDIWSISPQATAFEALKIMSDKDIGAVIVLDKDHVVGIFSERDYARKVILKGKSSKETSVGEIMAKQFYHITPDKPIEECMALMTKTRSRHMPIFENNKLIGLISIGDVVNAVISEQKITIQDLENYITRG